MTIRAFTTSRETAEHKIDDAFEAVFALEAHMRYAVAEINERAGEGVVPVDPPIFDVIEFGQWGSEVSWGRFDMTFASMGDLWDFSTPPVGIVPKSWDVCEKSQRIDYGLVRLNREESTIELLDRVTRIGLDGLRKGYAMLVARDKLSDSSIIGYSVQVGGSYYFWGRKSLEEGPKAKRPVWSVEIRDPRGADADDYFATIEIAEGAVSTAGDYEWYFFGQDGQDDAGPKRRYHHILDPKTGYPASKSRSVTVVAENPVVADILDNAWFVLGAADGEFLDGIEGAGAVIVGSDNKVWVSPDLRENVHIHHRPSDAP